MSLMVRLSFPIDSTILTLLTEHSICTVCTKKFLNINLPLIACASSNVSVSSLLITCSKGTGDIEVHIVGLYHRHFKLLF